jgi:hypothetical protein
MLRALASGEPLGPANWRCSLLHGAYLHVADDIGQHFHEAKPNDKRYHAESHYRQHVSPRDS